MKILKFNEMVKDLEHLIIPLAAKSLNNFIHVPMTDDEHTYEQYLKSENHVRERLSKIETTLQMFEVILKLDDNGLFNLKRFFLDDIINKLSKTASIWDIRQLKQTIEQAS